MSRTAVCIPVADDPAGLRETLGAIAALPDGGDTLVVVAVDGADPETIAVARELGADLVTVAPSQGSYAARNAAVAALPSDVDVVIFTDAGCRPRAGWINAHRRALDDVAMSGGAVEITIAGRLTPAAWVDLNRNLRQQAYVENDGFAATCNLAVRRDVLQEIRFDPALRSGGDRDFGVRARAAGFDLIYTEGAVVEHDARATTRAVLNKARRVGLGLAAMPDRSRPAQLPTRRPGLALARRAWASGVGRSPVWLARAAWVDNRRAAVLHRAATSGPPVDLHVVVLLASGWDALEKFSTRWREVVLAWSSDPRVQALTVVDHPRMRRRALLRRRLVASAPSWAPGVARQTLTLPVDGRRRYLDALGMRRAARQLGRSWPASRRRLVVAATPFAAPLLEHLRDRNTTVVFDGVDHWNVRRRFAAVIDRVESGYAAAARSDVVTAVAESLAEDLRAKGATRPLVVPNGVDAEALSTPAPRPDLGLPPNPFAVYLGTVGGRIDVDLLVKTSEELGDIPLVVAGPAPEPDAEHALRASAALWLGPVEPAVIPGLLQAAGCGLLPYRDTGLFEATDSMKLLQYLAAGLPVVSTPLPGLPSEVRTGRTAQELAAEIKAQMNGGPQPARTGAQHHHIRSWVDVADDLLDIYLGATPGLPQGAA